MDMKLGSITQCIKQLVSTEISTNLKGTIKSFAFFHSNYS